MNSSLLKVSITSKLALYEPSLIPIRFSSSHFLIISLFSFGKATRTCILSAHEISTPFITSIYSLPLLIFNSDTIFIAFSIFLIPEIVL